MARKGSFIRDSPQALACGAPEGPGSSSAAKRWLSSYVIFIYSVYRIGSSGECPCGQEGRYGNEREFGEVGCRAGRDGMEWDAVGTRVVLMEDASAMLLL